MAKLTHITAAVRRGDKRDAALHSVGANVTHGIRRTNADKRHAVSILLQDSEWGQWSSREIARRAGVSHTLVESVRASRDCKSFQSFAKRKGADGRVIDTTNIGASRRSNDASDDGNPAAPAASEEDVPSGKYRAAVGQLWGAGEATADPPPEPDGSSVVDHLNSATRAFLDFLGHESERLADAVGRGQILPGDAGRQLTAVIVPGAAVLDHTRDEIVRIVEDACQRIGVASIAR